MRPSDDSLLTPDERRSEVASILAAGVLRLSARAALPGDAPELPAPKTPANVAFHALRFPKKPCSVSTTTVNGLREPRDMETNA